MTEDRYFHPLRDFLPGRSGLQLVDFQNIFLGDLDKLALRDPNDLCQDVPADAILYSNDEDDDGQRYIFTRCEGSQLLFLPAQELPQPIEGQALAFVDGHTHISTFFSVVIRGDGNLLQLGLPRLVFWRKKRYRIRHPLDHRMILGRRDGKRTPTRLLNFSTGGVGFLTDLADLTPGELVLMDMDLAACGSWEVAGVIVRVESNLDPLHRFYAAARFQLLRSQHAELERIYRHLSGAEPPLAHASESYAEAASSRPSPALSQPRLEPEAQSSQESGPSVGARILPDPLVEDKAEILESSTATEAFQVQALEKPLGHPENEHSVIQSQQPNDSEVFSAKIAPLVFSAIFSKQGGYRANFSATPPEMQGLVGRALEPEQYLELSPHSDEPWMQAKGQEPAPDIVVIVADGMEPTTMDVDDTQMSVKIEGTEVLADKSASPQAEIENLDDHSSEEGMSKEEQNAWQQSTMDGRAAAAPSSPSESQRLATSGTMPIHVVSARSSDEPMHLNLQSGRQAANLAQALILKGRLQAQTFDRRSALADFERAMVLLQSVADQDGAPIPFPVQEVQVRLHLAAAQTLFELGHLTEAGARVNQALSLLGAYESNSLADLPEWRQNRAQALCLRAQLQSETEPVAAAGDYRDSIRTLAELAAELGDECSPQLRLQWSEAETALAQLYLSQDQAAAAAQSLEQASAALAPEKVEQEVRDVPDWQIQEILIDLGRCQADILQGKARAALDFLHSIDTRVEQLRGQEGQREDAKVIALQANFRLSAAQAADLLGRPGESRELLLKILPTLNGMLRQHREELGPWLRRSVARLQYQFAAVEFRRGHLQASQEACAQALALLEELGQSAEFAPLIGLRRDLAESYNLQGQIFASLGTHEQAMASLNKSLVLL